MHGYGHGLPDRYDFIDSPHGEAGITIFTMHVRVFVNELCTLAWSPGLALMFQPEFLEAVANNS